MHISALCAHVSFVIDSLVEGVRLHLAKNLCVGHGRDLLDPVGRTPTGIQGLVIVVVGRTHTGIQDLVVVAVAVVIIIAVHW